MFKAAEARQIWCNSADDPANCSAILPAVARRDSITVAVHTGGASPAVASWLRRRVEELLDRDTLAVREIAARVRAVLRRSRPVGPSTLAFGCYQVDRVARALTKDGEEVPLRPKEFDLLFHMASRPGEVMTRSDLLRDVWGSSPDWQDPGTVTVHVRRLRRLIEADAANPDHIVTVYGVGYRFDH